MSPRNRRSGARGFTLLEMLVALSLLGMLVAASVTVFRGIAQSWQRGETRSLRYQNARAIFDIVSRELSSTLPPDRHAPFLGLGPSDPPLKTGATGPSLFFVTLVPAAADADIVEIGYWLRAQDHMLMRHLDAHPDFNFQTADTDEPLGTEVASWSLSYFDGTAWQDHWDSRDGAPEAGRLPRAIRIGVSVQDPGGREQEHFDTTVSLPVSQP